MIHSKNKGKNFEREIDHRLCDEFGYDYDTERGRVPNSGGLQIPGDINYQDGVLQKFLFECKNQERLNIWKALEQAENDAGEEFIPVVPFTRNYHDTYVAMRLEDFIELLKE